MRTLGGAIIACALLAASTMTSVAQAERFWYHASTENILYEFNALDRTDGETPMAPVISDATGSLYGTTEFGGAYKCNGETCGTVFKLTKVGSKYFESLIHIFSGHTDGEYPVAPLLLDAYGTLYGTTLDGGMGCQNAGCGTAFSLRPIWPGSQIYVKATLYNFYQNAQDAAGPEAGLISDAQGNLYGTTTEGGGTSCNFGNGCGTVYELRRTPSGYQESVLYRFQDDQRDGYYPTAGLLLDARGALYGTTEYGGNVASCLCGTVFKLAPTPSGFTETILHNFDGAPSDGGDPVAPLIADKTGNLYGTTRRGGNGQGVRCGTEQTQGCGTAFRLVPSGSGYVETVVHNFADDPAGWYPAGALVLGEDGALYGATSNGASCAGFGKCGSVFALVPTPPRSAYNLYVLHLFGRNNDALDVISSLTIDSKGALYGTSPEGGTVQGSGTVFKLTP